MMQKILITGANGQLGKSIEKISSHYPCMKFIFATSKDLDITNKEKASIFFEKHNPNFCINCAAYTNVEQAEKEPEKAFMINAEGVKNMALLCHKFNATLIHISTDYVFDGKKGEPYTINDQTNPINEYGKSKLAGEKYIQEILSNHFIVRTSWLYSKEFGKNFYKTIVQKAKVESEVFITDNQLGCPTNTNNLAVYLLDLIKNKSKQYRIHHFCDGEVMTWYDFAIKIVNENNLNKYVKIVRTENYRTFADRPKYSVLQVKTQY